MPAAERYVPPTDSARDEFSTPTQKERNRRISSYKDAIAYYEGGHPEQLEVQLDEPNYNTEINMVRTTADRTASFLFPDIPRFELDPESIKDTPDETWLREFIDANGGHNFLIKWALRGFLSGHTFIWVRPAKPYPRLTLLDPVAVTVFWKADDVANVLWYENRYRVGGTVFVVDFVRQEGDTWTIFKYKDTGVPKDDNVQDTYRTGIGNKDSEMVSEFFPNGSTWEVLSESAHTHVIPPIIATAHLPHPDDYYGMSEFGQKSLQDIINRLWSEINRLAHENSDPVDVVIGAEAHDIDTADNILTIASKDARVQRLEMKGDLSAAVSTVEKLIDTYLSIARVVILKGEAKDFQRVTNAAVRTLFLDALSKNKQLQESYGNSLKLITRLALLMGVSGKETSPTIKWAEALPIDLTEVANINALAVNAKYMSRRTAATRLQLDFNFELHNMEEEADNALFIEEETATPDPDPVGSVKIEG